MKGYVVLSRTHKIREFQIQRLKRICKKQNTSLEKIDLEIYDIICIEPNKHATAFLWACEVNARNAELLGFCNITPVLKEGVQRCLLH